MRTFIRKVGQWIVAVYIRLSKEDGNDESVSVETQRMIITDYINKMCENENMVIYDYYIDDGLTGTDDSREAYQRMLCDIESKKVNCVIVKDLSRGFRNVADQIYYLEEYFVRNQVRFISIDLPYIDSFLHPESVNNLGVSFQGIMNENHPRETSIKVRRAFDIKRSEGKFIGAFAPYGYVKDPENKNQLLIDEDCKDIIIDMYDWLLKGMTIQGITKKLNALGIPNPTAYKKSKGMKLYNRYYDQNPRSLWVTTTVKSILTNEDYIGNLVQGKFTIVSYKIHEQKSLPKEEWIIKEGAIPAIISKETFTEAQRILAKNIKPTRSTGEPSLFSGLLRCADCGKAMHKQKLRQYIYYACRTYKEHGANYCTKHSIREDRLLQAVLVSLNAQLAMIEDVEQMIHEIANAPTTKRTLMTLKESINAKEKEVSRLQTIRDGLYLDWKDGAMSKADYFRRMGSYDEQLQQLEKTIESIKKEVEEMENNLNTDDPFFAFFRKFRSINSLERDLLLNLVEVIHIKENNEIVLKLRYADQFERIMELKRLNENTKIKKFDL